MMTTSSTKTGIIVGIAGGTASGKTTFTATLLRTLAATVPNRRVEAFNTDKYFRRNDPDGPHFISPSTGEKYFNANHPESLDNARLVNDMDTRMSAHDAPDVLIVEGLMVLHVPLVRERLDLRLFIELDADERALRRLLRDMTGVRGNTDPQFISTYYRECARIGHAQYVEPSRAHADLIIRGDSDFERVAPMVVAVIKSRCAQWANGEGN